MHVPRAASRVRCSPNSLNSLEEAPAIARRLALSLAIVVNLLATTAAWGAGSCSSQAHNPQLSNGRVSPATGTTTTVFTFSVTYADTKGCAPNWVRVTVAGVGVYPMNGSGTTYDAGVTFTRALQLPVGTHAYSFMASSGVDGGQKTTALASVTPPSVTVTAVVTPPPPTPVPTPVPTPKPPPKPVPTPVPTAPPTAPPTVQPTVPAPATPAPATPASGGGSGDQTPAPTLAPVGAVVPTPGPAASQDQAGAPGPSSSQAGAPGSFADPERTGSFALLAGVWTAVASGSLFLFLLLARRREPDEPGLATAGEEMPPPPAEQATPTAAPVPQPAALVPPDEVNVPRWLRPSVRAGRQGRAPGTSMRNFEDS